MAAVISLSQGIQLQCGVPFQCSLGTGKGLLQSISCSLQHLPCRKIGFGVYGLSLSAEKSSRLMEIRSKLGLGPARQPRLRHWNDWVDPGDFHAMTQDPEVWEEWSRRRLRLGTATLSPPDRSTRAQGYEQATQPSAGMGRLHHGATQQQYQDRQQHPLNYPSQDSQVLTGRSISGTPLPGGGKFIGRLGAFNQAKQVQVSTDPVPEAMSQSVYSSSPAAGMNNQVSSGQVYGVVENMYATSAGYPNRPTPTGNARMEVSARGREGSSSHVHEEASSRTEEPSSWVVPFAVSPYGSIPVVTKAEMTAMMRIVLRRHFSGRKLLKMFPEHQILRMAGAVGMVESSLQPFAYRYEAKRGEASTGLMQVLQSTADWLVKDHGYRAYEIDWSSSMLYRPFVAIYFGLAYFEWLSDYAGKRRGEEFVVRGYNGGPGGAEKECTANYWAKYLGAKEAFPIAPWKQTVAFKDGSKPSSPPKKPVGQWRAQMTSEDQERRTFTKNQESSRNLPAGAQGGRVLFDLSKLDGAQHRQQLGDDSVRHLFSISTLEKL